MMLEALRLYRAPQRLYLDNGSTYRGDTLETACGRLNITLLHASPYDRQARGKVERFWRTMREGCLSTMGKHESLHAVQVRLLTWLREPYHKVAHASLVGRSPAQAWAERQLLERTEDELAVALTVREKRRVRGDRTLTIGNVDWEVAEGSSPVAS